MCGIVGYVGNGQALSVLFDALRRVEYRGYDSCGVAVHDGNGITVVKDTGYVDDLRAKTDAIVGSVGIGHTRWATVGEPSALNAHPHMDCAGNIAIVHNGSIDNHYELRRGLLQRGHTFQSGTDTEVLAHLLEELSPDGSVTGVTEALSKVQGSYAIVALFSDSNRLVVARRGSPIVLGLGKDENMVGSDVPAVLARSKEVIYPEDGDIAELTSDGVRIWNNNEQVDRKTHPITQGAEKLDKAGYPHFLLKEIHEQPRVLRDTLAGRISDDNANVTLELDLAGLKHPEELFILGCGSASYACMVGEAFFAAITDTPALARLASEVGVPRRKGKEAWSIFLSQSGETADTVDAAKASRDVGHFTFALTNTPESSITRIVDRSHELRAGQEISVASTKTYLAQLMGTYLLGLALYPPEKPRMQALVAELRRLPEAVQRVLAMSPEWERLGTEMAAAEHAFIIGKGLNYPTALEGALKFKEVSYLHAEGYASGELKHGPFALLDDKTPVVAIMPHDETYNRMIAAVEEIHSRGASIIALTDGDDPELTSIAKNVVLLPGTDSLFSPIVTTVALQLMAYYCAVARECPIDRPRNLAKSVTVH